MTLSRASYPTLEIIDCGKVGFLGKAYRNGREVYRQGKHYASVHESFYALWDYVQDHMEELHAA